MRDHTMIIMDTPEHLLGPDKHPLKTHGQTTLRLTIGGHLFEVKATIASISQNLILGAQFLDHAQGRISFKNQTVTFFDDIIIPMQYIDYPDIKYANNCQVLSTVNNYPIPPQSVAWVPITFSPNPKTDLITVKQIGRPTEHQIISPNMAKVRYINDTDDVKWLHQGQVLALYSTDTDNVIFQASQCHNIQVDENTLLHPNPVIDLQLNKTKESERWQLLKIILESKPYHISEEQKGRFYNQLEPIQYVMAIGKEPLGLHDGLGEVINTDCAPIRHRPRTMTPVKQTILDGIIEEYKRRGILADSDSSWASPISLVPKKQKGEFRLVCDYRTLNRETIFDAYPLPNINQILASIPNAKFFSTLDLKMGYHQLKLCASDSEKSTIITPNGLFKFMVLPMGLTNASQKFMRVMQKVLNIPKHVATIFLDDVLIYGDTFEEHLGNLMLVLKLLYKAGIKVHGEKSVLFQEKVTYLGFIISKEGIRCTEDKLAAVKNYPVPKSPKECRRALGLFGYLRKFCPNYGIIAKPIFELTAKTTKDFVWTEKADKAFNELKNILISSKVLAIPRPDDTLVLTTDASSVGIGAVLQVRRNGELIPVSFASQALKKPQMSYSATKLEAFAIVHFVQYFKYLLLDKQFEIQSDHRPLTWLHNFKNPPAVVSRWLEILGEYKYTITYKPGKLNECADALSRAHERIYNITENTDLEDLRVPDDKIKEHQRKDPNLKILITLLQEDREPTVEELSKEPGTIRWYYNKKDNLKLINDHLIFTNKKGDQRLVVPKHLITTILQLSHSATTAGHRSAQKILEILRNKYHWIGMRDQIENYVKCCTTCGLIKKPQKHPKALLTPTVVKQKWEIMQIDIVGPYMKSRRGNRFLLTAICAFTKFARAWPLSNVTSETIARCLVDKHLSIFGLPQTIHSDNGSNFCSDLMVELYKLLGIRQTRSHVYCAFNNGMIERWHLTLEEAIATQANKTPRSWCEYVPLCVLSYNSQVHSSSGFSPFKMMFGEEARLPIDLMFGSTPSDQNICPHEYVNWLESTLGEIHEASNKKQESKRIYMKRHYDKSAYGQPHQVGDLVWILKGRFEQRKAPKLAKPFKGPYIIREKLSDISYKVENLTAPYETTLVHYNRTKKCQLSQTALKRYMSNNPASNSSEVVTTEAENEMEKEDDDPMIMEILGQETNEIPHDPTLIENLGGDREQPEDLSQPEPSGINMEEIIITEHAEEDQENEDTSVLITRSGRRYNRPDQQLSG